MCEHHLPLDLNIAVVKKYFETLGRNLDTDWILDDIKKLLTVLHVILVLRLFFKFYVC